MFKRMLILGVLTLLCTTVFLPTVSAANVYISATGKWGFEDKLKPIGKFKGALIIENFNWPAKELQKTFAHLKGEIWSDELNNRGCILWDLYPPEISSKPPSYGLLKGITGWNEKEWVTTGVWNWNPAGNIMYITWYLETGVHGWLIVHL